MNKYALTKHDGRIRSKEDRSISNQISFLLVLLTKTRQIFFRLLLIASAVIVVITATGTAIAWDGNFLIVDGQGDYANLLTEGTVDVATNATESFTVEFWVSPTDYGAIIRDDAYDVGYIRHSFHDLDGILFRIWPDQVTSHDLFIPVVLFNGWHHVAVMFDNISDRGAIAVNGNVFWSSPLGAISGLLNINQPFYVGSFTSSSGLFTGKIDEVRISDTLRYPYPVNSYTIPTLPFSDNPDTLALWHFDEAAGATSFLDSSGNGNTLTAHGDAVTASPTTGGNQTSLYLREYNEMTEEMGDPIPWVTKYIYPDSAPNSISWQTTLEGDITGSFDYSIDIVESAAPATLRIEFILDRDGSQSVVATDYSDQIGTINPPNYQTVSGTIEGLDLSTQDGDRLILRISHESGSAVVGIGLDGQSARSDSHIQIYYLGPVACFTLNPTEGDLLTEFNVNASCSTDPDYSTSALEVRWDWESDGTYDTNFRIAKTASHEFSHTGIKPIKLQVRNPDGITRTKIKEAVIDWVVLDSFSTPDSAPSGLTWDGTNLWLSDVGGPDPTIYKLTPEGLILGSFLSPCGDPFDLTWDGTHLWVIDAVGTDGTGHTIYKVDAAGNPITSHVLPPDLSHGLTWDGHFLWAADTTNSRIAKIDPNTGAVVASFTSPGPSPRGLAWDGQHLWVADWIEDRIYQVDVSGNLINTYPAPGTGPAGLTWDGSSLWVVDFDSYKVYKLTDRIPTIITCELSDLNITLGELLTVTGKISPPPGSAGMGVSIQLIPPAGDPIYKATLANIIGEFTYTLACGDIHRAGTWKVRTSWAGSGPYEGATSPSKAVQVVKATTSLTVNSTSQAIKLGETVDISGKFTPEPDCGGDLSGIPVELQVSGPGGSSEVVNVDTSDRFGHYVLQDYTGFDALGDWSIEAKFKGDAGYLASDSGPVQVRVVETAGYAIVVQGKISSSEGLSSHNKTANFVYNQLISRGLLAADIKYFNYNTGQPGVDGTPSKTAIRDAITQWAKIKMNAKPANLYIVMVDHGFDEVFYIHPTTITSAELAGWLTTLQGSLTGQAAVQEMVLLLGFCRSGSFIDELSGLHRVIIASAAKGESSYKGPLDADGIREGEYFISEFFKRVANGDSVEACFREATALTEQFTSSGTGDINAPYYDDSWQHPVLDDNADGKGSNDLSDPDGDGFLSRNLFIGVSSLTGNDPGDVALVQVAGTVFLGTGQNSADLWARVDNNSRLDTIWIEIKPPGYAPLDPAGTEQVAMDLTRSVYQSYNPAMDWYEWIGEGGFSTSGTYQVFYFAKDVNTGNVSPIMETRVYRAKSGNAIPAAFSLVSPVDGESVLTTLVLDWGDTTDPNGDTLSYTVLLSKADPSFSDPIRLEHLDYSTCMVSSTDGLEDLSTYYWKVQAIDQYGGRRETGTRVFHTNNTNPVSGWINGHVYNGATGQSIVDAVVSVGGVDLPTAHGGYYLGQVPPATYNITASASGCAPKSYSGVVIGDGAIVTKDFAMALIGDGDGDGMVDSWEEHYFGNLARDGTGDWDGDGLIDLAEFEHDTDPNNPDSDGDGFTDGDEVAADTDPNNSRSHPPRPLPWLLPLLGD
jgi:hypothetical protein